MNGMPAASSTQQPKATPKHTISGLKSGDGDLGPELARFGPVYVDDTEPNEKAKELNEKAKDSAWKHIVDKSGGDEVETKNIYLKSITDDIQKQALECYDQALKKMKRGSDFCWMMVRDGCFFIQLAMHILGGAEFLHYPDVNPYFARGCDSTSWIPAMFFVGNQIPSIVIRALMQQHFFKQVIKEGIDKGIWQSHEQDDDLTKLALYRTVVEPEVLALMPQRPLFLFRKTTPTHELPSNILHALHTSLLGPGEADPIYSEMRDFYDLEAGCEDSSVKIPSAGEIHKLKITLRKAKSGGISNIHFKNRVFWASLELPPLTINAHTKDLLTSLVKHEQNLMESEREVTAYLRFMRDLAHTYKDFKILEKKGLIRVVPHDNRELMHSTVRMLDDIVSAHPCSFTLNFRQTRHKIIGYGGPPWRFISISLSLFTIVQTIFTVLSYFLPHK